MDAKKRTTRWLVWGSLVLLGGVVAYPLSRMPVTMLMVTVQTRTGIPIPEWLDEARAVVYSPLFALQLDGPEWIGNVLSPYDEWWSSRFFPFPPAFPPSPFLASPPIPALLTLSQDDLDPEVFTSIEARLAHIDGREDEGSPRVVSPFSTGLSPGWTMPELLPGAPWLSDDSASELAERNREKARQPTPVQHVEYIEKHPALVNP